MKTEEDEAFEDIERRQGGGFKAKQAMAADKVGPFERWWYYEGSGPPQKGEDCEEHTKRMCKIAWSNGAYVAAQPAQEPVAWMQADHEHISLCEDVYHTIPLYTTPPLPVQEILAAFPLFDDESLDQEKHHCEWALLQDRKRLHAMLSAPPAAQPAQEQNTITFSTSANWVMRITADKRIEVNERVEVTEAAKKVLEAMQWMLKPTQEREALKLALEALEKIAYVTAMDYEYQRWAREAIPAIKETLAQPAQEKNA